MGVNECAFGRTADEVYCDIYQKLKTFGESVIGRNGQTKELTHVCMSISDPTQRWVERRKPSISPAFAIAELVMIMNGSDEAALLNAWNPALPKYQGRYERYPGAYGKRLRYSFGFDQINRAFEALKNNPESRQVVMEIWKPDIDLPQSAGIPNNDDIPCNICSLLKVRDGKLEWSQIMRSNDILLGMPYNFVQFTSLQEILAGWLGLEVGSYNHYSDSLHLYCRDFNKIGIGQEQELENTDSLSLGRNESEKIVKEIYDRMIALTNINISEKELLSLGQLKSEYIAYNNIMLMIAAYVAKKMHYNYLAEEMVCKCENEVYTKMWNRWMNK